MINLIVSPRALRGKGGRLLERVRARLRAAGREVSLFLTQKKGEAGEIARQITAEGESTIVAMGGDGTLNDVLCGIVRLEACRLGLIPAGTGNDFAAAAGIPRGAAALDLILGGEAVYTDYLEFGDGRRSLNIAGIGIDADILQRCERMKVRGRIKYFLGLLSSLRHYRGNTIRLELNGTVREYHSMIAAFCNGRQLGGGIPICPPAVLDDGKMDLVLVEYPDRRKILGALIKLMRGKVLSLPFAHHVLCERVSVVPSVPEMAQYDGELYPAERMDASIVTGKLRMFRGDHGKSV